MERIIEHIECLLLQHDCVIIPDFGGFVLQTITAEYLEESHLFTPSRKEIVFNPTLTHNDGLLSESYMQRYLLDFAKAQSLVKNDIAEMKVELDDYAELQLGSIGMFFKEEGRLIFMPAKQSDELFSVHSYGLPVFNFLPLSARDAFDMTSFLSSETKKKAETEKVVDRKKTVIYSIPVTRPFLRIVAASAAAILLFLLLATPISDVNKASYPASFVPGEIMPKKTVEEISMAAFMNNEEINAEIDIATDHLDSVSTTTTPAADNNSSEEALSGLSVSEQTASTSTPATGSPETTATGSPETTTSTSTPAAGSPETTTSTSTPAAGSPETTAITSTPATSSPETTSTTSKPATSSSKAPTISPDVPRLSSSNSRLSPSNSRLSSSSRQASATTGSTKYYVIIASYKTRANAQDYINKLKGIDKTNIGILIRDGRARVYAQIFSSEQEAQLYQKKINKDSWIYIVK